MRSLTPVRERWTVNTPPQKRALAADLTNHCLAKSYPWVSLSSFEREALRAGVEASTVSEVLTMAKEKIEERIASAIQSSNWMGMTDAAQALGVSIRWIRDCLETSEGRRLLGYPWYDGHRWHIPIPACHPHTRAEFLAALPESEPPENVARLTDSERQAFGST